MYNCGLYISKQNSLWTEGDVFREKMLNEQENGKMAVTRILSGVDDITINGSNKNRAAKKEEMELVSFEVMLMSCSHTRLNCKFIPFFSLFAVQ